MSSTATPNGTSSTSTSPAAAILNCHPSVWQRLNAIVDRRKNAKTRERDLVKHRKEVEGELEEIGATPGKRRERLCVDHWDTIKAIEGERNRIQTLADLLEGSIVEGRTGKLYENPEDLDAEIAAAEAEEEPELVKHAKQERKEREKQASQILKIEGHPSGELIVGRTYRFSTRLDPEINCLGVVQGFEDEPDHPEEKRVWIEASEFSAKCPPEKTREARQNVRPSMVTWLEVKGAKGKGMAKSEGGSPKAEGEGKDANAPAQAGGTGTLSTFPGRYIVRPLRAGAGSQCYNAYSAENLMSHCHVAVGAADDSTVAILDLGGGVGEVLLNKTVVAKVHYAGEIEGHENDPAKKKGRKAASPPAAPAAPAQAGGMDPKQNGKKPKEPAPTPAPATVHRVNDQPIEVGGRYRFVVPKDKAKAAYLVGVVRGLDDADQASVTVEEAGPEFPLVGRNQKAEKGATAVLNLLELRWSPHEWATEVGASKPPAKKLEEVRDRYGRPKKPGKGAKKAEASA